MSVNATPGAWQIPRYIEARGGRLLMDGNDLVDLAGARGTPLYVYFAARITGDRAPCRRIGRGANRESLPL
jgi:hypothetical protein